MSVAVTGRLSFDVAGVPVPQGSMKGFVRGNRAILTSDNALLAPWRTQMAFAAAAAREELGEPMMPLGGAVLLTLEFFLPVPRSAPKRRRLDAVKKPDLDKLCRAALDAFTGILFVDDSQVVSLGATKALAYDVSPGVSVTLEWS